MSVEMTPDEQRAYDNVWDCRRIIGRFEVALDGAKDMLQWQERKEYAECFPHLLEGTRVRVAALTAQLEEFRAELREYIAEYRRLRMQRPFFER